MADFLLNLASGFFGKGEYQYAWELQVFLFDEQAQYQMFNGKGLTRSRRGLQHGGLGQIEPCYRIRAFIRGHGFRILICHSDRFVC